MVVFFRLPAKRRRILRKDWLHCRHSHPSPEPTGFPLGFFFTLSWWRKILQTARFSHHIFHFFSEDHNFAHLFGTKNTDWRVPARRRARFHEARPCWGKTLTCDHGHLGWRTLFLLPPPSPTMWIRGAPHAPKSENFHCDSTGRNGDFRIHWTAPEVGYFRSRVHFS